MSPSQWAAKYAKLPSTIELNVTIYYNSIVSSHHASGHLASGCDIVGYLEGNEMTEVPNARNYEAKMPGQKRSPMSRSTASASELGPPHRGRSDPARRAQEQPSDIEIPGWVFGAGAAIFLLLLLTQLARCS